MASIMKTQLISKKNHVLWTWTASQLHFNDFMSNPSELGPRKINVSDGFLPVILFSFI